MKNRFIRFIFVNFLCIFLFLSIVNPIQADPTVGEIKVTPANPAPKSEVTISTDISGESVSKVCLVINECNKALGICYKGRNITMNKKSGNTYEKTFSLEYEEVTSITYYINLESNGKWIDYAEHTTKLSTGSGSSNESPGFEIILILIAIICFLIYSKKLK
jgi:hypothetical protein